MPLSLSRVKTVLQDPRVLFSAKFLVFFFSAQAVILALPMEPLLHWITAVESAWTGVPSQGTYLFVETGTFVITNACTGLVSWAILGSVLFALRRPSLARKTALWGAGFLVLFPLNLVRVAGVVWAGAAFGINAAEAVHVASWFMMSGAVLGLWYFLSRRFAGVKEFADLL